MNSLQSDAEGEHVLWIVLQWSTLTIKNMLYKIKESNKIKIRDREAIQKTM